MTAAPRALTNYDGLKLIALLTMTIDHVGVFLYPQMIELRVIGRIAAPIFCFLVGWNGSYRWRTELLLAALLVSGLNFLHDVLFPLNILWVILFGRMLMGWLERRIRREQPVMIAAAAMLWLPIVGFVFDYATVGLLWMLWGRQQRTHPDSAASYLYACVSFVGTLILMQVQIALPLKHAVAAGILLVATLHCLQRFRLREYPRLRLTCVRVLSRHTLIYYVLHLALIFGVAFMAGIAPLSLRLY